MRNERSALRNLCIVIGIVVIWKIGEFVAYAWEMIAG